MVVDTTRISSIASMNAAIERTRRRAVDSNAIKGT